MILFVTLPFIGGWLGYIHAPEKIIEVERLVAVHDAQRTTEAEVSFVAGQTLDFFGKVLTVDQFCEEPDLCRNYTAVLLPGALQNERILEARVEGDGCVDSSIHTGDIVKVSGKIFYVLYDVGLIFYCEQGVMVEKVGIANDEAKESSE